jgi:peptidoglycan hydrolase-like protein with peptidoglycan-binding domain
VYNDSVGLELIINKKLGVKVKTMTIKTIVFSVTLFSFSSALFAHQIVNEQGHVGSWNWNQVSHVHKVVNSSATSKMVSSRRGVVKGAKGIDGIAKAGECYVPAYIETSCKNEIKRVLVRAAYNETKVVPAVTKEIEKRVMVEPAKTIEEYVPALYENVSKRILIEEAHTVWKKGNSTSIQKVVNGNTYCLVNIPARYKTKIEKVLKIPASMKTREIPAVYKTYKEVVIVTPAKTHIIKSHPATYSTIQACVEKTAGHYQWRSILCEQNATISVLRSIEQGLSTEGYLLAKEVDGIIDEKTTSAIKTYQKDRGLSVDGLVNMDVVKSLGIKY